MSRRALGAFLILAGLHTTLAGQPAGPMASYTRGDQAWPAWSIDEPVRRLCPDIDGIVAALAWAVVRDECWRGADPLFHTARRFLTSEVFGDPSFRLRLWTRRSPPPNARLDLFAFQRPGAPGGREAWLPESDLVISAGSGRAARPRPAAHVARTLARQLFHVFGLRTGAPHWEFLGLPEGFARHLPEAPFEASVVLQLADLRRGPALAIRVLPPAGPVFAGVPFALAAEVIGAVGGRHILWLVDGRPAPPDTGVPPLPDGIRLRLDEPGRRAVEAIATDARGLPARSPLLVLDVLPRRDPLGLALVPGRPATLVGEPVPVRAMVTGGVPPVTVSWSEGAVGLERQVIPRVPGLLEIRASARCPGPVPGTIEEAAATTCVEVLAPLRAAIRAPGGVFGEPVSVDIVIAGGSGAARARWFSDGGQFDGPDAPATHFHPRRFGDATILCEVRDDHPSLPQRAVARAVIRIAPPPLLLTPPACPALIHPGEPLRLAPLIQGGVPPFAFAWRLVERPHTWRENEWIFTFDAPGRHTVLLTVTDAAGQVATCEVPLSVVPPLRAEILDLTVPADALAGQEVRASARIRTCGFPPASDARVEWSIVAGDRILRRLGRVHRPEDDWRPSACEHVFRLPDDVPAGRATVVCAVEVRTPDGRHARDRREAPLTIRIPVSIAEVGVLDAAGRPVDRIRPGTPVTVMVRAVVDGLDRFPVTADADVVALRGAGSLPGFSGRATATVRGRGRVDVGVNLTVPPDCAGGDIVLRATLRLALPAGGIAGTASAETRVRVELPSIATLSLTVDPPAPSAGQHMKFRLAFTVAGLDPETPAPALARIGIPGFPSPLPKPFTVRNGPGLVDIAAMVPAGARPGRHAVTAWLDVAGVSREVRGHLDVSGAGTPGGGPGSPPPGGLRDMEAGHGRIGLVASAGEGGDPADRIRVFVDDDPIATSALRSLGQGWKAEIRLEPGEHIVRILALSEGRTPLCTGRLLVTPRGEESVLQVFSLRHGEEAVFRIVRR